MTKGLQIADDQVTLEDAQERIARYLAKKVNFQNDLAALKRGEITIDEFYAAHYEQDKNFLRAFTIPGEDFVELANQKGVEKVRAYLGIKKGEITPCLLLVGVNAANKDIIYSTEEEIVLDTSGIYDFTAPCPDACDKGSQLFIELLY